MHGPLNVKDRRGQLKCDVTRVETKIRLSAKGTSPFKSSGASVQSTTDSRGVRISGSNAGYTMFRGSVKSTGYPLHSPVSPSLPLPTSPCAITFQPESVPSGPLGGTYSLWSVALTCITVNEGCPTHGPPGCIMRPAATFVNNVCTM